MNQSWSITWSHGLVVVHAGAGALGRCEFRLEDGRLVEPFHEAPWIGQGRSVEPPILANLRGDLLCLPFGRPYGPSDNLPEPWAAAATWKSQDAASSGFSESDELLHGYCANADWSLNSDSDQELTIELEYPPNSCIERVTRTVRPVPGEPALEIFVEIIARRVCARPIGFHPNFALRGKPGSFRIEPGRFAFGLTHPGADGVTQAKANARFEKLAAVPVSTGGNGSFDRLPFVDDREEILQLCGINGNMRLVDEAAQVAWTLSWDPSKLPSCLLWMSNRGRHFEPWNGENLCVGVEPVASAFDLGTAAALSVNPISEAGINTAVKLTPETPFTLGYRIEGTSLTR
jgi:hypothetical protein